MISRLITALAVLAAGGYLKWAVQPVVIGYRAGKLVERIRHGQGQP
jgi:hypothetical protein